MILAAIRSVILHNFHIAHQGMQRTKAHVKKLLYWHGLTRDIEQMVQSCATCLQFQPRNRRKSLISHDVPELPLFEAGADTAEIKGKLYQLLINCPNTWNG